jgi:hypothetical protein
MNQRADVLMANILAKKPPPIAESWFFLFWWANPVNGGL